MTCDVVADLDFLLRANDGNVISIPSATRAADRIRVEHRTARNVSRLATAAATIVVAQIVSQGRHRLGTIPAISPIGLGAGCVQVFDWAAVSSPSHLNQ